MAVKSSGTLGLVSDIVAEFGGSAPYALTDYYRGGGLVPDSPVNSGVPTSGTIALTDFYGAAAITSQPVEVTIGNKVVSSISILGYDNGSGGPTGGGAIGSLDVGSFRGETIIEVTWIVGTGLLNFVLGTEGLGASFVSEIETSGFGTDSSLSYNSPGGSGYSSWSGNFSTLPSSGTLDITVRG